MFGIITMIGIYWITCGRRLSCFQCLLSGLAILIRTVWMMIPQCFCQVPVTIAKVIIVIHHCHHLHHHHHHHLNKVEVASLRLFEHKVVKSELETTTIRASNLNLYSLYSL